MSQSPHLYVSDTSIHFGTHAVSPTAMAGSLKAYLESKGPTRRTPSIERQATALAEQDFASDVDLIKLIESVCWWGHYSGIAGRVFANNTPTEIRARLLAAKTAMGEQPRNLQTAIREARSIHSLGLSFASKHLRMLWPEYCPVLDSRIHKYLKYPMNSTGYCAFASDCRAVADFLGQQKIPDPARDGQSVWYVADVEAAVFRLLRR